MYRYEHAAEYNGNILVNRGLVYPVTNQSIKGSFRRRIIQILEKLTAPLNTEKCLQINSFEDFKIWPISLRLRMKNSTKK